MVSEPFTVRVPAEAVSEVAATARASKRVMVVLL